MLDNQEHYHASDRFPSRDTLLWLNSLEKVSNVSTDYTVSGNDDYLIVDTTAADVTITLPKPLNGRKLVIVNFSGTNDVILTSAVDINGSASDLTVSAGTNVAIKDIGGEWVTSSISSGGPSSTNGVIGTATLDFGSTASNETSVVVTGQTGISATSHVEACIMLNGSGDVLTDQKFANIAIKLACGEIVPGTGFTVRAYCTIGYVIGTFTVSWTWRD